ncbi:MAG: hypothetical protein ABJM43_19045 [Paracoccaceae bacterium]
MVSSIFKVVNRLGNDAEKTMLASAAAGLIPTPEMLMSSSLLKLQDVEKKPSTVVKVIRTLGGAVIIVVGQAVGSIVTDILKDTEAVQDIHEVSVEVLDEGYEHLQDLSDRLGELLSSTIQKLGFSCKVIVRGGGLVVSVSPLQ